MGKQAEVEAFWPGGDGDVGRLQYEPPRLIFRGAGRHVFEGAELAGVRAEGRDLVLVSGARFRLPSPAAGWADAILNPKGRLDKLGVKPGLRVGLINLDDPPFEAELMQRVQPMAGEGLFDLMFYGADSPAELAAIGQLVVRLGDGGALWVVFLKGKLARIKDVEVMTAAKAHGLVDIKVCAFSETRTALKFVRRRI